MAVFLALPAQLFAASDSGCEAGHDFVGEITVQPTCAQQGEITATCSRCGESVIIYIPAGDYHQYEERVTVQPGCETEGERTFTCTICGDIYTEVIHPLGEHIFGEWTVERPPEPGRAGLEARECPRDGTRETRAIPPVGATPGKQQVLNRNDAVIGTVNAGLLGLFALLIVPYIAGFMFIKKQRDRVRRAHAAKEAAAKHYDFH